MLSSLTFFFRSIGQNNYIQTYAQADKTNLKIKKRIFLTISLMQKFGCVIVPETETQKAILVTVYKTANEGYTVAQSVIINNII